MREQCREAARDVGGYDDESDDERNEASGDTLPHAAPPARWLPDPLGRDMITVMAVMTYPLAPCDSLRTCPRRVR